MSEDDEPKDEPKDEAKDEAKKDGPKKGEPLGPEEVGRRLAEFMREHLNENLSFASFPGMGGGRQARAEPDPPEEAADGGGEGPARPDVFEFSWLPRDIKRHLDRFVIRQDEAKKALAIAVCDHYNHARFLREVEARDPEAARAVEISKQNVIIVGPTGVGKTYLVKHIADLVGVPFVKADATKFSETGYVGGDVDDLVRELVQKADGDVDLAEHGIIYIDEIDKLGTQGATGGRDVSGRGVQTTLLKLMEDTEVPVRNPMDMQGQMQALFDLQRGKAGATRKTVRTRHILFIVSGAFSGLEALVRRRVKQGAIGFGADVAEAVMDEEFFRQVTTQDFIDFGFEAEFIGRLPVRVVCEHLSADDLFAVMTRSEGSLIRQYEREFEAYGIRATFDDAALRVIAGQASGEKTGARGLMTVCERLFRGFKFELPGTAIDGLHVDENLVLDPAAALARLQEAGRKIDPAKVAATLGGLAEKLGEESGVEVRFSEAALVALGEKAQAEDVPVPTLCRRLFKDYPFGIRLVVQSSGAARFEIPAEAVADPDAFLSDAVMRSYRGGGAAAAGEGS